MLIHEHCLSNHNLFHIMHVLYEGSSFMLTLILNISCDGHNLLPIMIIRKHNLFRFFACNNSNLMRTRSVFWAYVCKHK